MPKIDTVKARAALAPRRDPYWLRLSTGRYLGLRKMTAASTGNWIARAVDESTGAKPTKALGDFAELPDHQRFGAAKAAAEEWFNHLSKGGAAKGTTIKDVCRRYVDHLRSTKPKVTLTPYALARRTAKGKTSAEIVPAAEDAEARFENYVLDDANIARPCPACNASTMAVTA